MSESTERKSKIFRVEGMSDHRPDLKVHAYTDGPDWTEKPFISVAIGNYPLESSFALEPDDARLLIAALEAAVDFAERKQLEVTA